MIERKYDEEHLDKLKSSNKEGNTSPSMVFTELIINMYTT